MATFTDFTGRLREKRFLTSNVLYLSFAISPHFTFQAGQFITLIMTRDGEKKIKSYSILNPPSQQGRVDLCVKLIPSGFASETFRMLEVGSQFPMKGPFGHFLFDPYSSNLEHWFICTGTGLTPLYSIIMEYVRQFPQKKFVLVFGVRMKSDLFFYDEFRRLEQQVPNFAYIPTLSKESWQGRTGRVQRHLPEDIHNKTFYICGIKEVVLETKELLLSRGVLPENIKVERYT